MDEAVKAALGVLFHGDWNDTDGESVGMYLSLEMEDHAWEKRISEALSAADAARAVGDEEVVKFLPAWDDVMLQSVLAQMRREGFTVIRTQERAMEVSDEMVEAALDMWFGDENWRRARDDDHMPDRWRAEMRRALRAALAVMPDQHRTGWIAGRDAAAEALARQGHHQAVDLIRNMEPPA